MIDPLTQVSTRTIKKNHFAFTYRGGYIEPKVFESIGLRSLQMMEDPHGEKYALITLHKPRRTQQVLPCITDWNFHQLGDAKVIQLSPHPGNDEIITFGKGMDTMANHYVYKTIMAEKEKAARGESHTYREWISADHSAGPGPSRMLKGLQNNLADGYIKPACAKRAPVKVVIEASEVPWDTVECKGAGAAGATETEDPQVAPEEAVEDPQAAPEDPEADPQAAEEDPMAAPEDPMAAEEDPAVPPEAPASGGPPPPSGGPPPPASDGPAKPMPTAEAKQVVMVEFDAVMGLAQTALKAKDEALKAKDDLYVTYKEVLGRELDQLTETRKEVGRLRALTEVTNAQYQELNNKYVAATGKPFKPAPKRRSK